MDEICSLNIHLWYVDKVQKVLLKSLHAQKKAIFITDLVTLCFSMSYIHLLENSLRMEEFQNNFF